METDSSAARSDAPAPFERQRPFAALPQGRRDSLDHLADAVSKRLLVVGWVKRMQAAGFIGRIRNPADERQVFIELTECGKSLERGSDVRRAVGASWFRHCESPLLMLWTAPPWARECHRCRCC